MHGPGNIKNVVIYFIPYISIIYRYISFISFISYMSLYIFHETANCHKPRTHSFTGDRNLKTRQMLHRPKLKQDVFTNI
jgi:hypothetical protein